MGEGNSLINFGDLSKPATVLIEKISDAIGTIYEPTQIKRVAKAEVEADRIKALASIETSHMEQRAITRLIQEEGKKQENIESITAEATHKLNDDAKPEDIEDDWIAHFFEKCRNISDKDMQSLWSNLLSGEANKPGSYSKRTLELVSTLDKSEAHLFTKLCSFAISAGEIFPLVVNKDDEIYSKNGVNFSSLNHLEAIGLIKFNDISGFVLQNLPKETIINYYGMPIHFMFSQNSGNNLEIGNVMLTKAGQQLASVCGSQINGEFISYIIEHYKKKGIEATILFPNQTNPADAKKRRG